MKRFSFPLLLLLAYFLAEEFLSPEISVIVIAALGLGEFAYTRIKEKTYDCLTLFMTLLFCLPGSISLISGYTLPTIAQSVVIELSILIMLAIPVCSKKSISSILPASYRKNMAINEEQEKAMKRMMGMLLVIITLHLVATILVHYFSTEATSTFVNGPLLYILIALFFLVLFVRQRIMIRRYQKEEWLPVVDEKGKVIGKAGRSTCHSGSKLLH
ncbi:NUDIX hydrolase, partial [Odoribacter sp. OttesenSCG-928-A06]|nr:NUDIX hydrolase [Odoribacter sp. OttesenSCG-928-A06]